MRKYVEMFRGKVLSLSLPTYGKCSTSFIFSKTNNLGTSTSHQPQQTIRTQHTFSTRKSYIFFSYVASIHSVDFFIRRGEKTCLVWGKRKCMNFLEEKQRNFIRKLCILYMMGAVRKQERLFDDNSVVRSHLFLSQI